MPSRELQPIPAHLARLRELYPAAVGYETISGSYHRVRAEVARMEKRGEIVPLLRFARERTPGVLEVPYVRLKSVEQVRRSRRARIGAVIGGALLTAAVWGWLIWESRRVLELLAVIFALAAAGAYLSLHWRNGCTGLHCSGCRG